MPFIEFGPSLHVPYVCTTPNMLHYVLFTDNKLAVLDNKNIEAARAYEEYNIDGKTIKVNVDFVRWGGINEEWLRTPIKGKHVYVPVNGGCSWLPLSTPAGFVVKDEEDPTLHKLPDVTKLDMGFWGYSYAKVILEEEETLADLVCNAYKYTYDPYRGAFILHDDPDWNAIKGLLRRFLITLSGGTDERVADYGRIILFLLSKVNLTDEEKEVLQPILDFSPTADSMKSIIRREAFIQKFVAEAKKDPHAFLHWGANWTKFWWDSKE